MMNAHAGAAQDLERGKVDSLTVIAIQEAEARIGVHIMGHESPLLENVSDLIAYAARQRLRPVGFHRLYCALAQPVAQALTATPCPVRPAQPAEQCRLPEFAKMCERMLVGQVVTARPDLLDHIQGQGFGIPGVTPAMKEAPWR